MHFHRPGHFVSRAPRGILVAPFAPLLLQCTAGFVCSRHFCWSGSHHLPTFMRHILQPHSSATARYECLRVLPVPERVPCQPYPWHFTKLCKLVYPWESVFGFNLSRNPILVIATSCHRSQDRFYLSFFKYIEPGCHLPISVSIVCFFCS